MGIEVSLLAGTLSYWESARTVSKAVAESLLGRHQVRICVARPCEVVFVGD